MHGARRSRDAFAELPDFPEGETADLTRRVLLGALPALAEEDFEAFCDQVGYLQRKMGAYFAPMQGGAYVSATRRRRAQGSRGGWRHRAWAKLLGPDRLCLRAVGGRGPKLLAAARGIAGSAKLRLELARGRNEPATIETR